MVYRVQGSYVEEVSGTDFNKPTFAKQGSAKDQGETFVCCLTMVSQLVFRVGLGCSSSKEVEGRFTLLNLTPFIQCLKILPLNPCFFA